LMSRIQLANYFKQQCFDAIGINPQRLGGAVSAETATGVVNAMQQSYAQTEIYFTQHSDHLMPRVHQMRTDLAQYYQSTNPSIRLNYITTEAEKVNFVINGTDLLLRDFNVFVTSKTNHRAVLEQLKQMALTNNTTGASIYELGNIIKSDNIAEVSDILKDAEQKMIQQRTQDMQQQREMQEAQLQQQAEEARMKLEVEQRDAELERQKDITIAEIRSAGYAAQADINQNQISDYRESMKDIQESTRYREQMNIKRDEMATRNTVERSKADVQKQKIAADLQIANTNLEIARENKNKYDVKSSKDKKS